MNRIANINRRVRRNKAVVAKENFYGTKLALVPERKGLYDLFI